MSDDPDFAVIMPNNTATMDFGMKMFAHIQSHAAAGCQECHALIHWADDAVKNGDVKMRLG